MATGLAAQLIPTDTLVHPGGRLTYTVLNTGTVTIAFGRPSGFEHLGEDGWQRLRLDPGFRMPLYTLHPAHARQLKLKIPRRMPSGRYRLTLEVRDFARRVEPRFLKGVGPSEPAARELLDFEFDVAEAA